MSHYRDILSALQKLKAGAGKLTTEQYVDVLEAIEQAAQALYSAPRGADPAAMGVWWNHERTPALARLADTLSAHEPVKPIIVGAQNGGLAHAVSSASAEGPAQAGAAAPAGAPAGSPETSSDEESAKPAGRRSTKLRAAKDGDGPSDAELARALYNALLDSAER